MIETRNSGGLLLTIWLFNIAMGQSSIYSMVYLLEMPRSIIFPCGHLIPGIDAVIMPVVSRNTIKRGNKRVVKLGDKEIVLNAPWPILTVDAGDAGDAGRAGLRLVFRE